MRRALAGGLAAGLLAVAPVAHARAAQAPRGPRAGPGAQAPRGQPRPDLRPYYRQTVEWGGCPGEQPPTAQCGTVTVPVDYARPDGRTLQLAVSRIPATGPGGRLGSMLVNFGGPGLPGIAGLGLRAGDMARLGRRYDLIGFDPRGTGASAPVDCGDLSRVTGPAQLARACASVSGWLLPYLSTANTARDLDVIRATLGDSRLTYLGFSYGSTLGAVYAHEFPGQVGRMVLDGVPDPELDDVGTALAQARAFQKALLHFAADCAGHRCPVPGRTGAQVVAAIDAAGQRYARHPLSTDEGELDRTGYLQGLRNALYAKDNWPFLRAALAGLRHGDGDLMMQLAWPGGPAQAVGDFGAHPQGAVETARVAIDCRDTPERRTPAGLRPLDGRFAAASPVFGHEIEESLLACTGWPRGTPDARDVTARTAPQALLVSTTGDPATPYPGAFGMARALGDDSRVLTHRGEGHGAYFAHSPCVERTVDAFFLDGALPPAGAVCG